MLYADQNTSTTYSTQLLWTKKENHNNLIISEIGRVYSAILNNNGWYAQPLMLLVLILLVLILLVLILLVLMG